MEASSVPIWAFSALMLLFNGLLGLMMMRLWTSVDSNTKAVTDLAIAMPTTYATKIEVDRHHDEDKQGFAGMRIHIKELTDKFARLDKQVAVIDGGVKDAQAGLRE